eukprot:7593160-Pyramimonas_sp.AAC.1
MFAAWPCRQTVSDVAHVPLNSHLLNDPSSAISASRLTERARHPFMSEWWRRKVEGDEQDEDWDEDEY